MKQLVVTVNRVQEKGLNFGKRSAVSCQRSVKLIVRPQG